MLVTAHERAKDEPKLESPAGGVRARAEGRRSAAIRGRAPFEMIKRGGGFFRLRPEKV